GRRARLADEAAVGLRIFVETVAAQREKGDTRRHLALTFVEAAKKRTAAVELVVEGLIPSEHPVIGHAAQDGVAHVAGAAPLDVAADRITAARIANQGDARRA